MSRNQKRRGLKEGSCGDRKNIAKESDRYEPAHRAVWVMVPAGSPTEETVAALGQRLDADDVVIDGGNSYFKDDVRGCSI